ISEVKFPRFEISFGGKNKNKDPEIIEVADFIGVKSFKARGKRLTRFDVKNVKELEPVVRDEDIKPEIESPIEEKPIEFEIVNKPAKEDPSQMKLEL
ncbi:MAG: DNA gyrase/topoisomerase IV subunit A, partial [Bacteroidota bacterium]